MNDIKAMSFEEAMAALERVVRDLESGQVSLDQSIALYEQGAALKAQCETLLRAAEERVEKITLNEAGQPAGTTPLEGL
ncbi:exodeoxyribonuclease VII small subunit [Rhodobacter veldkampii DSM 11550]|uniref:Exodeoxyribonuclease 7 small subunit n=1 Tax=Phaeovulum veldkampii DSM 11550 TaxID=1185920 RepID=A0A2T4JLL4_9RHOB|nr:exodeoxyribonuclease VII small subunit [Phaeovulum veldkampii]MBK5947041.1 exodeoxyribonuclease VII small subunit [Phaeovulum veldkampii DSM 11550]NCU19377.1 exodeoxyribonuclease VII small subunit [Candidatus Falkowbacteria bacterium]PTE18657.1 exodeoxyribonuclease VII small subunit [Phaeovulum veldkampii DSM 11550]TDQ57288.1 exodeoxyribonuclease VII small subunit [Phaeovulum veldkampii DSM 11550]